MDRSTRVRRVFIVCANFARNIVYYRAGWHGTELVSDTAFYRTINGNFIDIAVLEWCKLFGDLKAKHHWRKVVRDPTRFEQSLLSFIGLTLGEFESYIEQMRTYRDKFLAHLDSDLTMEIPLLETGLRAVEHLHAYLLEHQLDELQFAHSPLSFHEELSLLEAEAEKQYAQLLAT